MKPEYMPGRRQVLKRGVMGVAAVYVAPRIESVLTAAQLQDEIAYAGGASQPPPNGKTCEDVAYDGPNPFALPGNYGDVAARSYVRAHVDSTLQGPITKTVVNAQTWTSPGHYAVVLVKVGGATDYNMLYVNVVAGQVIKTHNEHDIFHVSTFVCD